MGPALNGVARRRTPEWIEEQIRRPQSHFPETMMPPLDLAPRDMERLVAYLLSLPYIKPFSVALADGSGGTEEKIWKTKALVDLDPIPC